MIMSVQVIKKQKVSKNFQKLFPPIVCVYCGCIIEEQHESYLTKCNQCLSKENEKIKFFTISTNESA